MRRRPDERLDAQAQAGEFESPKELFVRVSRTATQILIADQPRSLLRIGSTRMLAHDQPVVSLGRDRAHRAGGLVQLMDDRARGRHEPFPLDAGRQPHDGLRARRRAGRDLHRYEKPGIVHTAFSSQLRARAGRQHETIASRRPPACGPIRIRRKHGPPERLVTRVLDQPSADHVPSGAANLAGRVAYVRRQLVSRVDRGQQVARRRLAPGRNEVPLGQERARGGGLLRSARRQHQPRQAGMQREALPCRDRSASAGRACRLRPVAPAASGPRRARLEAAPGTTRASAGGHPTPARQGPDPPDRHARFRVRGTAGGGRADPTGG